MTHPFGWLQRWNRIVYLGPALLAMAVSAAASERDEQPGAADERYALSAAQQSGRFSAWRLDRQDGRVSVCVRLGSDAVTCSPWSVAAGPAAGGPFAINAENSSPVGTLWVWRIDTVSGRLDYCQVACCGDLADREPVCLPGGP